MITQCYICKGTIDRPPSLLRNERNFCSRSCYVKFQSTLRGEQVNNWKGGGSKFNCKVCLKPCERERAKLQPKYCSIQCATKDRAQGIRGEKHWNWKGGKDTRWLKKISPPKPDRCEVCGEPGTANKKGLKLDHDHKTNKFRGWLCNGCNTTLGHVKENPQTLLALIKYLEINGNSL